ncbi:MAG: hypothetical protein ABIN67_07680 [Ferruginibacter sp.]
MKKQSETLFAQISDQQVNSLTTIVKETLATSISKVARNAFSAADLWNIQRQKKSMLQRRYSF